MSKDITKLMFKILLWIFLAFVIVCLIFNLLNLVSTKFGGFFGSGPTVEQIPLQNGLKALTNGGLTPQEFEKQRQDENAPYSGDEVKNFYIRETDKYVIFHRQADLNGSTMYPNISFVKTDKGLVWDGAWGVTANLSVNKFSGYRDFENIKFQMDMFNNSLVYSNTPRHWWDLLFGSSSNWVTRLENIVTFSDFNASFCPDFYSYWMIANIWVNNTNDKNVLFNKTHDWLLNKILVPYFEMLDEGIEFEMGNNDSDTLSKLNACFTYLWNNCKTEDLTSKETIVDVSKYYGKIIPEEERSKYPIPEEKQEEYGNKKYYSAYYCKIYANCYYSYYDNIKVARNEEKIKDYVKDYSVDEIPENQTKEYSQLKIKFANKDNSDLTGLSLSEFPVKVNINNVTLTFDNLNDLHNGKTIVVEKNTSLQYTIISDGLVFDSYSGVIVVNNNKVETYFKYSYMSGYIAVSVSLQPLGTFDLSNLDLASSPFIVHFYSKSEDLKHYMFVFDSNSKINDTITQYMLSGEYDVLVSSDSVLRVDIQSPITINPSNRKLIFTYYLEDSETGLILDCSVSKMIDENGDYVLSSTSNDVRYAFCPFLNGYSGLIDCYPNATESDKFSIRIKIFDSEGTVVAEIFDEHNAKVETDCNFSINFYQNLNDGETYYVQAFLATPDNIGFIVSPLCSFIYENAYVYNIDLDVGIDSSWSAGRYN